MIPAFRFLGRDISSYMLCVLVGVLTVLMMLLFKKNKRGMSDYNLIVLHVVGLAGVYVGMHLLYAATMYKRLFALVRELGSIASFADFAARFGEVFGGAVFYGGLLGGLLAAAICYKKLRLTPDYADLGTCSIPLFHFFGRIGCFLAGCCYGIECPVGFTYRHALDEAANNVTRFPVQLLEAGFNLLLFLLLLGLFNKGKLRGKLLRLYLVLYPVFRFADEFLRGDRIRGSIWILSTSQWISLLILVSVAAYTVIVSKREKSGLDKKIEGNF